MTICRQLPEAIANPEDELECADALALLYEAYKEITPMGITQIKADFDALYQTKNGMELKEIDRILYPVGTRCCDRKRARFMKGVKTGVIMGYEQKCKRQN